MTQTHLKSIQEIAAQLKQEEQFLKEGRMISDYALKLPTLNGAEDKKTQLAHKIARFLFPTEDQDRVHSYIAYSKLLSKLRAAYRQQIQQQAALEQIENLKQEKFREARKFGQRQIFESLLDAPISDLILNPTPMPVETAPLDELTPFFAHLKQGQVAEKDCVEFLRGAYYNDGRIDMCKQVVGSDWISELIDSIEGNANVEHFLLGNNIVGDRGAAKIAALIQSESSPAIKTYYLAGNCFTAKGAAKLSNALQQNHLVESVWLKRNPLKIEGVRQIAKMLEVNQSLQTLDLVNVGMLDGGTKILFESLKKNKSLRTLYIDANGITVEGARYIADYFEYLKQNEQIGLTGLFMAINRLGDRGVKILAEAISSYPHLKRLDVSSNRIQNSGLAVLLEKMNTLPQLIYLGIGLYKSTSDLGELPNYFDGEGAEIIANAIKTNQTLQVMDIKDVNLRDGGLNAIAEALEHNTTLLDLSYAQFQYSIPEQIATKISNYLARNLQKQLGMEIAEFRRTRLREIKHTNQIGFIDSIYRNRS
jgi:Ran GTPase-activating protein (RanGAP) involved in mRNA processing and transport